MLLRAPVSELSLERSHEFPEWLGLFALCFYGSIRAGCVSFAVYGQNVVLGRVLKGEEGVWGSSLRRCSCLGSFLEPRKLVKLVSL